ncbi:DsrE family protein [Halorubellus salinus]|uniref:DsrE family protein n=1 Tax=Halorubellus salinus TaxID=755309 RepID=UPI001D08DF3E|nr:DsrE family protein [Halorubellus salinus]
MTGYAIVIATEDFEKITASSIISSVAAASDVPVDIFVTMNGLRAFEREVVDIHDFDMGPLGEAMLTHEDTDVPLFTEQFAQAKEIGPLSVYACSMAMEMWGRELDDYVDVFDDELGVSGFLGKAEDKQVVFV